MMRRIGVTVGLATLLASGTYLFVYLYRWEWNRALVSGLILVATEVALVAWYLNGRLRRLSGEVISLREQQVLRRIKSTAPTSQRSFAWLSDLDRTHVFIPVLLGAGVVVSALAWTVERVARMTARPMVERGLARRLGGLTLPADGFIETDDPVDRLRHPRLP